MSEENAPTAGNEAEPDEAAGSPEQKTPPTPPEGSGVEGSQAGASPQMPEAREGERDAGALLRA